MDMKLLLFVTYTALLSSSYGFPGDNRNAAQDEHSTIAVRLSAVNDRDPSWPAIHNLTIKAKSGSNLGDVMKCGEHQHPLQFCFTTYDDAAHGTFLDSINKLSNTDPWYWQVFYAGSMQLLPTGLDNTYPKNNDAYIWRYSNQTHPSKSKQTQPSKFIFVTIYVVNDRDPWWPGIRDLQIIAVAGSNLGAVMERGQIQHRFRFRFTTDVDSTHGTYVESINGLVNDGPWNWLVYYPDTRQLLPTGLDDTYPLNEDAYFWRYSNETHPPDAENAWGKLII